MASLPRRCEPSGRAAQPPCRLSLDCSSCLAKSEHGCWALRRPILISITVIVEGTDSELTYKSGWGEKATLGDYRPTPVQVKSNPLRIFPCHIEGSACLNRFVQWREDVAVERNLKHISSISTPSRRQRPRIETDYARLHSSAVFRPNLERGDYIPISENDSDCAEWPAGWIYTHSLGDSAGGAGGAGGAGQVRRDCRYSR